MRTRAALISVLGAATFVCTGASGASAATEVGNGCTANVPGGNITFLMTGRSPSNPLPVVFPADGVVTSWRMTFPMGANVSQKLKIARPTGGSNFLIVTESSYEQFTAGTNSKLTRLPVRAGDILGLYGNTGVGSVLCTGASAADTVGALSGDQAPGTTSAYGNNSNYALPVVATVEPDADSDGYGDETQDLCPTDAAIQGACPAPPAMSPETFIDKHPKKKLKTKKRKVTVAFRFSSSAQGASFTCRLDDGAAKACASPYLVKVGRGKHRFKVTATDSGGHADATPATFRFKVKRKRRWR